MDELVIKVPSPFSGVDDVGFSARYPAQAWNERLRDVPFIVEGPPRPMRRLVERLSLFTAKDSLITLRGDDEAYSWTAPVQLTDEVCVLAFRDHSLREVNGDDDAQAGRQYIWNLVRPLAFTFLRDCVRLGGLRLADSIAVVLDVGHPPLVGLELKRTAISAENGTLLLAA
ncbi:MAG: hypothetical protein JF886_11015 [Candidatus Dormibacteraeota bacterium]|nr:hypothetical protein [Candidatus Dormibacteraeota bacterium]